MVEVLNVQIQPVLIAAFIHFVITGVFFSSPIGKFWVEALNKDKRRDWFKPSQGRMGKNLATSVLVSFVQCYVLAHSLGFASCAGGVEGMIGSVWVWLGYIFATRMNQAMWQDQPWALMLVDTAGNLMSLLAAGFYLGHVKAW